MVQSGMKQEHRSGDVLAVRRSEERMVSPGMCRFA